GSPAARASVPSWDKSRKQRKMAIPALARRHAHAVAMPAMADTADLSPTIVDALYCEALVLADEARSAFDLSGRLTRAAEDEDLARIALSCEALRTTTRMMHAIAWL